MPQVDVAELAVDVVEAQLVRQGHIEHKGLEELLVAGHLREDVQVAHHLEAVRYLDHADPRVGGVLDYQFLVFLRLQARVLGLYRGNLVEAVHHHPHVLGKCADVYVFMAAGGLVEIDSGNARLRQAYFVSDDMGRAVGMLDEGRSVVAGLAFKGCQSYVARFFCHLLV